MLTQGWWILPSLGSSDPCNLQLTCTICSESACSVGDTGYAHSLHPGSHAGGERTRLHHHHSFPACPASWEGIQQASNSPSSL